MPNKSVVCTKLLVFFHGFFSEPEAADDTEMTTRTNGEVLHKMKIKRSLLNIIKKKKMSIFWAYNKRRWGTTIADGRRDKW